MSRVVSNIQVTGASGLTIGSANVLTLASTATAARTLTLPDETDTLVGKTTTDVLTNKTLTAPAISAMVLTGISTLTGSTLNNGTFATPTITGATMSGSTLTTATITAPDISAMTLTGTSNLSAATLTSGTFNTPTISAMTLTGSSTLTGATLTAGTFSAPILTDAKVSNYLLNSSDGQISLPVGATARTLVSLDGTEPLTNKSLLGITNNVEANKVGQAANAVAVSGAASAGYVLKATSASTAVWAVVEDISYSVQTTNATSTNIAMLPTTDKSTFYVDGRIVANRKDGTENAAYSFKFCFVRAVGIATIAQLGSTDKLSFRDANSASWDVLVTADVATGSIKVNVVGEAAKQIDWKAYFTIDSVAST